VRPVSQILCFDPSYDSSLFGQSALSVFAAGCRRLISVRYFPSPSRAKRTASCTRIFHPRTTVHINSSVHPFIPDTHCIRNLLPVPGILPSPPTGPITNPANTLTPGRRRRPHSRPPLLQQTFRPLIRRELWPCDTIHSCFGHCGNPSEASCDRFPVTSVSRPPDLSLDNDAGHARQPVWEYPVLEILARRWARSHLRRGSPFETRARHRPTRLQALPPPPTPVVWNPLPAIRRHQFPH
jgi:hypothetical protein